MLACLFFRYPRRGVCAPSAMGVASGPRRGGRERGEPEGAPIDMLCDREIWTAAILLVDQRGELALAHALDRFSAARDNGDGDDVDGWGQIAKAIDFLQRDGPGHAGSH